MRSGRLNTPATLLSLGPDLHAVEIDWLWCGIQTKENAEPPPATGLRAPAKVTIRAWWDERIIRGRYLRTDDRLFLLDDVRDFTGKQQELAITASELVGLPGRVITSGNPPISCRIFIKHGVSRPGELTGRAEYTTQLEAAVIEVGRPQPGAVFQLAGEAWRVVGLVDEEDDGVTRRMWVKPA